MVSSYRSVSTMRLICSLSILAALSLTLDADNEELNCEVGINVRRHTVYKAFVGGLLNMSCPVSFCKDSPPALLWYKHEETDVLVNVSDGSRIKAEWKESNRSEGTLYLIFQKVLRSDSGQYQCHGGGSQSHYINITVYGDVEVPTVTTAEPPSPVIQDALWPYVYRAVGILVFFIIVMAMLAASGRKGRCCAGRSQDAPDLSCQPSHHALPDHVYEND